MDVQDFHQGVEEFEIQVWEMFEAVGGAAVVVGGCSEVGTVVAVPVCRSDVPVGLMDDVPEM